MLQEFCVHEHCRYSFFQDILKEYKIPELPKI